MFFDKRGFTLIEMLLVIAIIRILAGAVYAMIGNSSDAKTKSALSTMKSIMPYAQECQFKEDDLNAPDDNHSGGGAICPDSETNWPAIGPDECDYDPTSFTAEKWVMRCIFSSNSVVIDCDAGNGVCTIN